MSDACVQIPSIVIIWPFGMLCWVLRCMCVFCIFPRLVLAETHRLPQMLRQTTKEVLYEKYRTEKLLARRATQILPAPTQSTLSKGGCPFLFVLSTRFLTISLQRNRMYTYTTPSFERPPPPSIHLYAPPFTVCFACF
jgi:hypothetical protein